MTRSSYIELNAHKNTGLRKTFSDIQYYIIQFIVEGSHFVYSNGKEIVVLIKINCYFIMCVALRIEMPVLYLTFLVRYFFCFFKYSKSNFLRNYL